MAKKSVKTVVHLRVYKGREMSYDKNGKPQNENQIVKIQSPSIEWNNFLKYLRANAYCEVEVEKVVEVSFDDGKETISEIKDDSFKAEVENAFRPKVEKQETAEEKRIAELERKIEELTGGKKTKKAKEETKTKTDEVDRDALIAQYEEVFGKKIFPGWSNEQIQEKINNK